MDKFSSPAKMFKSNLFKYLKRAGITVLSLALVLTSMITVAKDEALSYSKAKSVAVAEIETITIDDLDYAKIEYAEMQRIATVVSINESLRQVETTAEAAVVAYAEATGTTESTVDVELSDPEETTIVLDDDEDMSTSAQLAGVSTEAAQQTALEVVESEIAAISIQVSDDNYETGTYLGTYTATAYCGCSKCCGKSDGITASGVRATQGRTVAAPSTFAFGTELIINGVTYVVEDRGGSIKGNRIDIYFENHSDALAFGRKTVEVYIK